MATANEILFRIAARTDPSLTKTLTSTTATLNSLGDEIRHLNAASGQIQKYKNLRKSIADSEKTYHQAQQRVAQLAREMQATDSPTKKMRSEFDRATREAGKLKSALRKQKIELHDVRGAMDKAGVSTKNLRLQESALEAQTRKLAATQGRIHQLNRERAAIQSKKQDVQGKAVGVGIMAAGLVAGAVSVTKAYGEIASAQGEIQSLGIGSEGIDKITAAAKRFSNQWAGTTAPDFIRASYDIKSGISTLSDGAVAEMTKIAGITAVATKSTTAEMTSLFAKGYGVYRSQFEQFGQATIKGWNNLSEEEKDIKFGEYFSTGIASAVQAFKTDGAQMSQAISTLGASATSAGHSYAEQLSILGTLQQTMSGSEAATKYRAFLDKAADAGDKIGISMVDANNNLLSTPEILNRLKSKYGETLDAIEKQELKKAFGTKEAVAMIDLLYGNIDNLKGNIESLNGSMSGGMSVTQRMADAINSGPNQSMQIMSQQAFNAASSVGKLLTPTIMFAASGLGYLAGGLDYLVTNFPIMTSVILGGVAGFVFLRAAQLAYQWSSLQVVDTVKGVRLGIIRMRAALSLSNIQMRIAAVQARLMSIQQFALRGANMAAAGAQWVMNTAMAAFPLVWILAAIAGVIGGVWLLVENWDTVSAAFMAGYDYMSDIWNSIDGDTQNAVLSILAVVAPFIGIPLLIANNWEWFKDKFAAIWDRIEGVIPDWAKAMLGMDGADTEITANMAGLKVANSELPTGSMAEAIASTKIDKSSIMQKLGVPSGGGSAGRSAPSIPRARSGSEVKGPEYRISIEQTIHMHGAASRDDVVNGMDESNRRLEKDFDDIMKRKKRLKFEGVA